MPPFCSLAFQPLPAAPTPSSATSDALIDGAGHALGDELRAVLMLPDAASAAAPVPGCLVVHGSGGLFCENAPGDACGPALETSFRLVSAVRR